MSGEGISDHDNIKVSYIKINLWNIKKQTFIITNIFYSTASPKIVILINNRKLIYLIDTGAEIYLIREEKTHELGLNYITDRRLKLIDMNRDETIIMGICENVEISISPVTVVQTLMMVENASQDLVLGTPYIYII